MNASEPYPATPFAGLRVLAADDNEINRKVIGCLLQVAGVTPDLVDDGEQAVAAWRSGDYDLILMDLQMPNMDGLTAARTIRMEEARSGACAIPIIAVTATAEHYSAADFAASGLNAVVPKPLDVRHFYRVIEGVMAREPVRAGPRSFAPP